jgi:hypothetical protein
MRYSCSNRYCWLLGTLVFGTSVARAQIPLFTPPPVSSQVRQKLRVAILEVAASPDPNVVNVRPDLALPLAQVGDWNAALRLLKDDLNAPQHSDELWQWRAYQLARAGKWREVPVAASNIRRVAVRADALLFAARTMVDRGIMLDAPDAASGELKALLLAASPLLKRDATIQQRAYYGYLWARGGDYGAAERVFARTVEAAKRLDAHQIAEYKENPRDPVHTPFSSRSTESVLLLQARSGLLQSALRRADQANDYLLGWWIAAARTQADLHALSRIVEKLPAERRVQHLFELSMVSSMRGDKVEGRVWFEQARQLATTAAPALTRAQTGSAMFAFYAAHFLQDTALEAQTMEELRALAAELPESSRFMKAEEIAVLPAFLDLQARAMLGDAAPMPSLARLNEITAQLQAAPPSDMQFRALETVATHYFLHKQPGKLLSVAQTLLQTARSLAAAETTAREKKPIIISPYWPRSPRVLTAVFWLQRAGDAQTAATFAREFARSVPERERPYAAMALFQLGFPRLADSVFDPKREIPRIAAYQREQWKKKRIDWDTFTSWGDFAATEAQFRAPDAPFRWLDKVEGVHGRAQVLRGWIAALYPEPRQIAPFVHVSPTGSSSSF